MFTVLGVIFLILIIVALIRFVGEMLLGSVTLVIFAILGVCTLAGIVTMIGCFA